jgi:hypothetical protein
MKNLLIAIAVILAFVPAFSQDKEEETIFGGGELRSGGYGAPVVKFTKVLDDFGVMFGARGGWIINSTFSIGGGGYGLVTSHKVYDKSDTAYYLRMNYGGVFLEYINSSDKALHFTVNALVGGGNAANSYKKNDAIKVTDDGLRYSYDGETSFFVIEPGATVDINMFSFMRLGLGASYRFITGVDLKDVTNQKLSGPSGSITLKFGKF